MKRQVIVFFDLEGWLDAPSRRRYDMKKTIDAISRILDRYGVRAAFNTCGSVVEHFPGLVKKLSEAGHEIASHGYAHENMVQLEMTGDLDKVLRKTEDIIEDVIGTKPVGFRSPWLFHNERVYKVLRKRGYRWASNKSVFRTELLGGPAEGGGLKLLKQAYFGALWQFYKKGPFNDNGITEIPLLSSQDGEVLGHMDPQQHTPGSIMDFAYATLKAQFDHSGKHFNLNFHPWLIGSSNRLKLLERILEYASSRDASFVLPREIA
jgi:peptidoglycan/xylan/chitin deacetylase (PgdA/CDA1 family)